MGVKREKMNDLLLITDMQNAYKTGETWACRNPETIGKKICELINSQKPHQVIFTRFDAPDNPNGTWKDYNKEYAAINQNEYQCEIMELFNPYMGKYPVYSKSTYSSYSIEEVVQAVQEADRVLLTGVVAECCILATLESLIDAGAKVLYVKDAISGQTKEFEDMILKIAEGFSTIHTQIITVDEYLK